MRQAVPMRLILKRIPGVVSGLLCEGFFYLWIQMR